MIVLLQVGKTEKTRHTNKDRAFNLDMCRNVCVVVWVGGGGGERQVMKDIKSKHSGYLVK